MPAFELYNPHPERPAPPLPPNLPDRIPDIHKRLNDMGWVAEVLGLKFKEAEALFDVVHHEYIESDGRAGSFTDEMLPVVHAFVSRVLQALDEGMDEVGHKRGPIGDKLVASSHFKESPWPGGAVLEIDGGPCLTTLRECAFDVRNMLEFAMANGLWVQFV